MDNTYFKDFDFSTFWDKNEFAEAEYLSENPDDKIIQSIEEELGYKLPASYIHMMKIHNGGMPVNTCFAVEGTSWADDHISINGIYGIGRDKDFSLGGSLGSKFMISEWGYPEIGVYVCDCPSGGHDMVLLDYSKCGPQGEPEVMYVEQESDYRKTFLAKDFETFILRLVSPEVYDNSAERLQEDLLRIDKGKFSTFLQVLIDHDEEVDYGKLLRKICRELTEEKGYFALHDDAASYQVYDLLFMLCSQKYIIKSRDEYYELYPLMLAETEDGEFSTNGFAPMFIVEWFNQRADAKQIISNDAGELVLDEGFREELVLKLNGF